MAHSNRLFRIEERFERNGEVRLELIGEFDLAVVELVASRLRELRKGGYGVRLDLSRLTFLDSSGVREIIRELGHARDNGWELEVDGPLTEAVARTVDLLGARAFLWPEEG
jgi:anti-anti-sigma factor